MEEFTNLQGRGAPWELLKNFEDGDGDRRLEEEKQVNTSSSSTFCILLLLLNLACRNYCDYYYVVVDEWKVECEQSV